MHPLMQLRGCLGLGSKRLAGGCSNLLHRCLSANPASDNVIQMDPATLQSLASLIYSRTELFHAYLSRSETEVALQLQQLIGRLDGPRRTMLMQKLSAVSGKRAAPIILAWTASNVQQALAMQATSSHLAASSFYPDLLACAQAAAAEATARGQGPTLVSEADVIKWFLFLKKSHSGLTWDIMMQMPRLEEMLAAACAAEPKLSIACSILGLDVAQGPASAGTGQALLRSDVTHALGALTHASRELLMRVMDLKPGDPVPLNLIEQAASKHAAAGTDGAVAAPPPELAAAAVGLALSRWVSCQLGLSMDPGTQLVTRMLGTSPFQVPGMQEGTSPITLEMLHGAVQQLAALPNLDALEVLAGGSVVESLQQHSQLGRLMAAAAKEGGPAAELMKALFVWRKNALTSGVPCIMSTVNSEELAMLSDAEAVALLANTKRLEAAGRALESLVLPSQSGDSVSEVDLDELRSLSLHHRLGLAWSLRTPAVARQAAAVLLSALHTSSLRRHRDHDSETSRYDALVNAFALERRAAELDILGDGLLLESDGTHSAASSSSLPGPSSRFLSETDMMHSVNAKKEEQVLDLLLDGGGSTSEAQVLSAFEALLQGMEGQEDPPAVMPVPDTLQAWISETKMTVNKLSPAMLSMLRRFLALKIRVGKTDALEAQRKTRLLLAAVQAEIRQADRVISSSATSSSAAASPYWTSLDVAKTKVASGNTPLMAGVMSATTGAVSSLDPDLVRSLLDDPGAKEFNEWLRSAALLTQQPLTQQPYELLAERHLAMDVERYLQMRHNPELSLSFESPPRSWQQAGPLGQGSEEEFLEGMKEGLSNYLATRDLVPLGTVEWEAYKGHALSEFSVIREAHESELREAGHSTFFNSRAEMDFLRSMIKAGVPSESPIHDQAVRYLEVLETNSSWSFAQKKQVVERLIELSEHFSKQGAVTERGSPFAPLFSSADGASVTPKLKAVLPVMEMRELAAVSPEKLPKGY